MGKVSKSVCLLLVVILTAMSLLAAQSTYAQSIPKPSVPEFTVELINNSTTVSGNNVEDFSIVVTIKNQPVASEWADKFCYNVRIKSHSSQNWTTFYFPETGPKQSSTGYTKISYEVSKSSTLINLTSNTGFPGFIWGIERNSPIDFQVEAVVTYTFCDVFPGAGEPRAGSVNEESGWSNTQTISTYSQHLSRAIAHCARVVMVSTFAPMPDRCSPLRWCLSVVSR